MMYLPKTLPCTDSLELPLYDGILIGSFVTTPNIDLDDDMWGHALLPERWVGLVFAVLFRWHCLPTLSAYMADSASETTLHSFRRIFEVTNY
jgi:hypothetical protein